MRYTKTIHFVIENSHCFNYNLICKTFQDDTDGMVQSLPIDDDDEELSFSSYATAKTEQLTSVTGVTGGSVRTRTSLVSDTSDTLVGDDQFHTLQDVEDLTPDTVNVPSLLSLPPEHLSQYIQHYNQFMPVGQGTSWCPDKNYYSGYIRLEMNLASGQTYQCDQWHSSTLNIQHNIRGHYQ